MPNNKTDVKLISRKQRGQTSRQYDQQFSRQSDNDLLILLRSDNAQQRTAAANLLEARKCIQAVPILCECLKNETALYARIAISAALGAIGEPALNDLIRLLGKVSDNQHKKLPQKGFYKKSYPLPRDIVARTIIKIGRPALKPLENVVLEGEQSSVLEAIDALGHIAFYTKDARSEAVLFSAFEKYSVDQVIQWKIVSAFQSFSTDRVQHLLENLILTNPCPAIRWEAVRSLGQLGVAVPTEIILQAQQDRHAEVRNMAQIFLSRQSGL